MSICPREQIALWEARGDASFNEQVMHFGSFYCDYNGPYTIKCSRMLMQGTLINDIPTGLQVVVHANGQVVRDMLVDGQPCGPSETYKMT